MGRKRSSSLQNLTGARGSQGERASPHPCSPVCNREISRRGHPGSLRHPAGGRPEVICRTWFSPCSRLLDLQNPRHHPTAEQRHALSCRPVPSPRGLTCPGSERSRSSPDTRTPTQEQTAPPRSHACGSAPGTGETETREELNTGARVQPDRASEEKLSPPAPGRGSWASPLSVSQASWRRLWENS